VLLGSVSQHVALHAHGPVVVVRGRPDAEHGPVVVGVNGSSESQEALLQAFEEAISRHTGVLAVHADMSGAAYWLDVPGYVEAPQERREAQTAALVAEVSPWAEKFPDVPTRCVAIEGHPTNVLTDQSATARLVVVGNRVHNGISGMLLGSVGLHLLHHAQCPVLLARSVPR
jgi:nucleotide-binding universal stress UspA family protein